MKYSIEFQHEVMDAWGCSGDRVGNNNWMVLWQKVVQAICELEGDYSYDAVSACIDKTFTTANTLSSYSNRMNKLLTFLKTYELRKCGATVEIVHKNPQAIPVKIQHVTRKTRKGEIHHKPFDFATVATYHPIGLTSWKRS